MILTVDVNNKAARMQFTDAEWLIVRYINKVYGSTAFKLMIENLIAQKASQKSSSRSDKLLAAYGAASAQIQSQILANLSLDFGDE